MIKSATLGLTIGGAILAILGAAIVGHYIYGGKKKSGGKPNGSVVDLEGGGGGGSKGILVD